MHLLLTGGWSMYDALFPTPGAPNLTPISQISTGRPESVKVNPAAKLGWLEVVAVELLLAAEALLKFRAPRGVFVGRIGFEAPLLFALLHLLGVWIIQVPIYSSSRPPMHPQGAASVKYKGAEERQRGEIDDIVAPSSNFVYFLRKE